MVTISANDIKKRGISSVVSGCDEVVITIRGVARYMLLEINKYEKLREAELIAALTEAREELECGDFVIENVDDHIKRIAN